MGSSVGSRACNKEARDTLFVAPPLVISRSEIDELLTKVVRSLDETLAWARAEGWLSTR